MSGDYTQKERGVNVQRKAAVEYLRTENVAHPGVGEWPAFHILPYLAIWAIQSELLTQIPSLVIFYRWSINIILFYRYINYFITFTKLKSAFPGSANDKGIPISFNQKANPVSPRSHVYTSTR